MLAVRKAKWLIGLLAIAIVASLYATATAEVRVSGYYRKNGTYVAPHYRSSPNKNFYDNWSTKGNINPHTGKRGTRVTPPAGYTGPGPGGSLSYASESDTPDTPEFVKPERPPIDREAMRKRRDELAKSRASDLAAAGVSVNADNNWEGPDISRLHFNMGVAQEIESEGATVDWQNMTAGEVYDVKVRIKLAIAVTAAGYAVDWQDYSTPELNDMRARQTLARYLRGKGISVVWQQYSYAQLSRMTVQEKYGQLTPALPARPAFVR